MAPGRKSSGPEPFLSSNSILARTLRVDVQWKWLHVLLAWRFQYTFYVSVKDDAGMHDKPSEKELRSLMDDKMEGVQLEIGGRY